MSYVLHDTIELEQFKWSHYKAAEIIFTALLLLTT